jgi:spermidine synthase
MKSASRRPVSQGLFWLASILFFTSGATGLAYQVIWFKRFAHVWGSSSLAFASVGASFLFGLGLGAYLIGRYADYFDRPLRWYGVCELAIGALALVIPFEIQFLIEASANFYSQLPDDPLWRYLVQFAVTLLVVGPPCILMGGTLPLLIRQLTARDGSIDQATGWLYAINTFGAAFGCYITGFHLLAAFGLYWTNIGTAVVNLLIGVVAVAYSMRIAVHRLEKPTTLAESPADAALGVNWSMAGLYLAVALSGLGALVLEMTWSRQLALAMGGSTYAYSSTLFVVLVGIALGSLIFHVALRPVASRPWLPVAVIGILAVSCLVGHWSLPALSAMMGENVKLRATPAGNALVCSGAAMWLELLPSIAMGILFPLFVHLTRESAAAVGRTVGDVYAWNTLGSIAGASLTAVLLFPIIGTAGAVALAVALYVLALLLVLPIRSLAERGLALGCLAVGAVIVYCVQLPQDPMLTNIGMYMYGAQKERMQTMKGVYFAEGASSNVFVTRVGSKQASLRVNGKVDASDGLDMQTQLGLAYFPRLLNPTAKDVLVIGFGSGTTSGTSLLFPDTQVTCCEIEPAVYRASEQGIFDHINHRPYAKTLSYLLKEFEKNNPGKSPSAEERAEMERQARFRVIFGDGRSTLQGSNKKYDLVISEPSNPWLAGVSNLFTKEFFAAARKHLNPGGVLAQWIQTYNFTRDDYMMIVRTLLTEFKHCGMVKLANGADTILLASNEPLTPTQEGIAALQKVVDANPEISQDLKAWFTTTDLRLLLLRFYTGDERTLVAAIEDAPSQVINEDLNLRLEFDAPTHLFQQLPPENAAREWVSKEIQSDAWTQQLASSVGIETNSPEYHILQAEQEVRGTQDAKLSVDAKRALVDKAIRHYQDAISLKPDHSEAYRGIAQMYSAKREHDKAVAVLRDLLKKRPRDTAALALMAEQLVLAKQPQEAIDALTELVKIEPKRRETLARLSNLLVEQKQQGKAIAPLQELVELEPQNAEAQGQLADVLLTQKRATEAIPHLRKALELRPLSQNDPTKPAPPNIVWANNLAWVLATHPDASQRNGAEALRWAEEACKATGYKLEFLDTLAAAHAEAGQWDQAIKYCEQFLSQAQISRPDLVDAARSRLKLYQAHQPYRES